MEDKQAFSRAIKLLHSKAEDSEVQLLQLVDDVILKKYDKEKSVMKVFKEKPDLFSKDHVPSFLKIEDKPPGSDSSELPLYLDHTSNSPGVISIPDEPSRSLLELEQDFEASISNMEVAFPVPEVTPSAMEVDTEAGSAPVKKVVGTRKKKSTRSGSKEQPSVLDEVLALMDKGMGKKKVGSISSQKYGLYEGQTQVPCLLCTVGKIAKAVTCQRCKETFLVCCIEISASNFDPNNWSCDLCAPVCNVAAVSSEKCPADPQLQFLPSSSKATTAYNGHEATEEQKPKQQSCKKYQKQSTSSVKPKSDQPSGSHSTRSRKTLNFEKKLQNIKNTK